MKRSLIALALVFASSANAECYSRTAMTNDLKGRIQKITDIERMVTPVANKQLRCVVTFRALIDKDWYDGEGVSQGSGTENQVCAQAQNSGVTFLLQSVKGSNIAVDQEMVCTDQPKLKYRPVKPGDIISESEVKPHPKFPKTFAYMGTSCKWFLETDTRGVSLTQWQGVMCDVRNGEWKVIDKF